MGILKEVDRLTKGRGIQSKKEDKIRIDVDVKVELEKRKVFFSSDKKISYSNTIGECLALLNEIENIVDKCDGGNVDCRALHSTLLDLLGKKPFAIMPESLYMARDENSVYNSDNDSIVADLIFGKK